MQHSQVLYTCWRVLELLARGKWWKSQLKLLIALQMLVPAPMHQLIGLRFSLQEARDAPSALSPGTTTSHSFPTIYYSSATVLWLKCWNQLSNERTSPASKTAPKSTFIKNEEWRGFPPFTHWNITVLGLSYKTCCNFFLSCRAVTVPVSTTVLPQYFFQEALL